MMPLCGILPESALFTKTKSIFIERNAVFFSEIITCDPSYTMDHPDFIVCSFMEISIVLKPVKGYLGYTFEIRRRNDGAYRT